MSILRVRGIIALDRMDMRRACAIIKATRGRVFGYKAHMLTEPALTERIAALKDAGADWFWQDRKAHDTPDTVAEVAGLMKDAGAQAMTVHASGEIDMMVRARIDGPPTIFGITELTSLTGPMVELGSGVGPKASVLQRARNAKLAGITGIVCSADEVGFLHGRRTTVSGTNEWRELHGLRFVVPGTRTLGDNQHDQARSGTAPKAIKDGADYLVLGREVTGAEDPNQALDKLEEAFAA